MVNFLRTYVRTYTYVRSLNKYYPIKIVEAGF